MAAATYNFPTHIKGDTFQGMQFTLSDGVSPIDITGYTIECKFRLQYKNGKLAESLSTTSGITITDASNGVFQIDPLVIDWDAGRYYYDIEFTDTGGIISTYIQGIMVVNQDVTYG